MWTKNLPTEPGIYIFDGFTTATREKRRRFPVEVRGIRNGLAYIASNEFLNPDKLVGWWYAVNTSEAPPIDWV